MEWEDFQREREHNYESGCWRERDNEDLKGGSRGREREVAGHEKREPCETKKAI